MAVRLHPEQSVAWAREQKADSYISTVYDRQQHGTRKPTNAEMLGSSYEARCLWNMWEHLKLENEILIFQFKPDLPKRLVLPLGLVQQTLKALHQELGHPGQGKMIAAARHRYWWPNQHRDVVNFGNNCSHCASFKSPSAAAKAPLQNMTAGFPNEIVGIDLIGPLPITESGNRYILVMVDLFTKWCEAVPLAETDAVTVGHAILKDWVARWGAPLQLHSDQGSNFESQVISSLCDLLHIRKTRTTTYHPQGNGQVERTNRTIKGLLKAFVDSQSVRSWDRALPHCLMAYRGSIHTSTAQSPFFLTCGRELRLPTDLCLPRLENVLVTAHDFAVEVERNIREAQDHARIHLGTARRHQKSYYDLSAHGSPFEVDDCVWFKKTVPAAGEHSKFFRQWIGPFIVIEVLSQTSYLIRRRDCPQAEPFVAHFNKLKICTDSSGNDRPLDDGQMENVDPSRVPLPEVDVEIPAAGGSAASFQLHPVTEDSES